MGDVEWENDYDNQWVVLRTSRNLSYVNRLKFHVSIDRISLEHQSNWSSFGSRRANCFRQTFMSIVPHQTFYPNSRRTMRKIKIAKNIWFNSLRYSSSAPIAIHPSRSLLLPPKVFLRSTPDGQAKANNNKNAFAITFLTSAYGS